MMDPLDNITKKSTEDSSSDEDLDVLESRKALDASAKAVIRRLNPEGKSELGLEEVLGRIRNAQDGATKEERANKKHVEQVVRKLLRVKGEKGFSEEDMKKLNQRFMNGHLPRLKKHHHGKDSGDEEIEEDEVDVHDTREGMIKMMIRNAVLTGRTVSRYAEKSVSRTGRAWMWTLLPTGQISTLLSFLLFSYVIKASFLAWFIPLVTLIVSLGFMLVSSVRIIRGAKRFAEFKAWAEFLDEISATEEKCIDTCLAEENYIMNHLSPYIHFLVATAFCVMGYGTSDKTWVLNAELGVFCCFMYGTVVYIHGFHKCKTSLSLFGIQILATLLGGFRCSDGDWGFGFLASFCIPFTVISLNLSMSSVLRVIVIIRIISLSLSYPRGQKISVHVVKVVLPHIVALVWWDVAGMFFCYSSFSAVARASMEYFALLFAMPAFVMFLTYTLILSLFSLEGTKLAITIAVIGITVAYFTLWKKKKEFLDRAEKAVNWASLKKILGAIGFFILGYIMLSYRPSGLKMMQSNLSWVDYRDSCLRYTDTSLPGNNMPKEALCYEFKDYGITWDGTVENINIVKIENKVEDLLNLLPHSAANWLGCMYGESYPSEKMCAGSDKLAKMDKMLCRILPVVKRRCHIQNHNIYTFKITVSMPSDVPVHLTLDVPHDFYDLVSNLKAGAPLRFTGIITEDKTRIVVKVLFATTDGDEIKRIERRHKRIEKTLGNIIDRAFDSLCDFMFYPILSLSDIDDGE